MVVLCIIIDKNLISMSSEARRATEDHTSYFIPLYYYYSHRYSLGGQKLELLAWPEEL